MYRIICVAGMAGAGKSVVSDFFVKDGYQFVRFGQIVLDEIQNKKLKPSAKNEKLVREALRKKHGMAGVAVLNYPKFASLLKKGNVIADGLYSWSEYKYLKMKFGQRMVVVSVFAPPELRYQRLAKRNILKGDTALRHRPLQRTDAEKRDFAEIENIEKGGPITMADYTLLNTKSMAFLKKQINFIQIDLSKNTS